MERQVLFKWFTEIEPDVKSEAEQRISKDIRETMDEDFCHPGNVSVELSSRDPLHVSIQGAIKCSCGKVLFTLVGKSDASELKLFKQDGSLDGK